MENKMSVVVYGFTIVAIIGILIGFIKKNLALWLSIGIGSEIAIGVSIGALGEYGENKKG